MLNRRAFQAVSRLVRTNQQNMQARRTLYPHYLRYMAVANKPNLTFADKVIVYLGFLIGILGPPTYIMYDVGHKRPDSPNN